MSTTTFTDPTDQSTIVIEELADWIVDQHANDDTKVAFKVEAADEDGDESVQVYLSDDDRIPLAQAVLGTAGTLSDAGWLASTASLRDSDRHTDATLLELARRSLDALAQRRVAAAAKNLAEIERKAKIKALEVAIGQRPLNLAAPLAPQLVERGIVAA